MRVTGEQNTNVKRYSSMVVEKGCIVRGCKRIEKLRVIQGSRMGCK
jgi:hypothetical protein